MSLNGNYDPDNTFAKILRGEIPCAKICENETSLAFMDAFPQSYGHSLIIPKQKNARNLLDLPPESLTALILQTQKIARAIASALKPDGIQLCQFNGASAGQTVFHPHFHIIPHYHTPKQNMTELQHIAHSIAACLNP